MISASRRRRGSLSSVYSTNASARLFISSTGTSASRSLRCAVECNRRNLCESDVTTSSFGNLFISPFFSLPPSPILEILSLLKSQASTNEVPIYRNKDRDQSRENRERYPDGDVGDTEEAVAEAVDEIKDGVHVRKTLCPGGERVDRVENAAEVHERGEDEGRYEVDAVDAFGVDAVDQTREREHERG